MATETAVHRFTVDQFQRMAEIGIFHPDERVELIDGEIFDMAAIGVRHAWCVDQLTQLFVEGLQRRAVLRAQNPAVLGLRTFVQPDILVLHGPVDRYRSEHPDPEDILLLIEVSDTTLRFDRSVKLPIYARMGVVEAWIVDLQSGRIEVHREPSGDTYGREERVDRGSAVAPLAFPDLEIEVDQILP